MIGFSIKNDLAASLGKQACSFQFMPNRGLMPSGISIMEIKDWDLLKKWMGCVNQFIKLEIKACTWKNHQIYYLLSPMGKLGNNPFEKIEDNTDPMAGFVLSMGYGFSGTAFFIEGNKLYYANTMQDLKTFLEERNSWTQTLQDSPDFKKVAQYIPENSSFVAYFDGRALFNRWWNTLTPFLRYGEGFVRAAGIPFESALLPRATTLSQHMAPGVTSYVSNEDGILFQSLSFIGGGPAIIVGVGVAAAVAVPMVQKAKVNANAVRCKANLMQLGTALHLYRTDYNKWPPAHKVKFITELYKQGILVGPEVFVCPESGDSTSDEALRNDSPDCTSYEALDIKLDDKEYDEYSFIPVIWDKYPHPDGTLNVLFLDGHVDAISDGELQELIEQLKKKQNNEK